jgi:ribosomal protein S18 acetylase RimI-like enzyme
VRKLKATDVPDLVRILEETGAFTDEEVGVALEGNFDIYWIATDPAVQGKGLGRKLMEYAEAEAQKKGARMVCLETSSQGGYERTRRFYDQAGYIEESRIRDFYKPGDDRLTYVKRFSALKEN